MPREMFKNTISKFIYAKTKTICDELWDFRAKLINEENLPTSFFPRYDMEYIGNYGRKLEQWLNDDSRNDGAFVSFSADEIEAKFHTLHKKVFALFEAKIKDLDEMELFQPTKEEELKLILKHYPLSKIDFCFLPELKDKYETKEPNLFNDEELKPSKQSVEIKSYDEIMEAKLRKRGKF
ncbi:hypothetical protein PUT20_001319 [Campylobacter upsaliensis]|nr:hypothetical protein [Campylobacter upsaliensis]